MLFLSSNSLPDSNEKCLAPTELFVLIEFSSRDFCTLLNNFSSMIPSCKPSFKLDICKLAEQIQDMQELFNSSHLIIEESSISTSFLQYISQFKSYPYKYRPKGDKISRANDASFHIKAGKVKVLSNTSWLDEFKTEINSFPNGKHDDQIDALSQLIDVVLNNYNPFIECAKLIKEEQIKSSNQTALSFCQNAYKYYKSTYYSKHRL